MGSNRNPLTHSQVIDATINCIRQYGVAKTSMIDVAKALGVTRQTVHRLFETRADLLEAVAEVRIEQAAERLRPIFRNFSSVEEALVEGSLKSLEEGHADSVLDEIQQQADHSVDQYMFRGSPKVQAVMLSLWGPILDDARAAGQIAPNCDNETIVEWIRNIHAMVTKRSDYDENKLRSTLTDFLVPSIVRPAAGR